MVVEYIRYRIPLEQGQDFAAAHARAATVLDADQHCLGYEIAQGLEEPENWVVRITWDSLEATNRASAPRHTSLTSSRPSARSSPPSRR